MKLPRHINRQVLEYLRLEYGESDDDPDALKLSDLTCEGKCVAGGIVGIVTHFWAFPSSAGKRWAIVEQFGKTYSIGTSARTPEGETTDERKALRTLHISVCSPAGGLIETSNASTGIRRVRGHRPRHSGESCPGSMKRAYHARNDCGRR
jgi:hypothetical protein